MIRLVGIDVDGTLVGGNGEVSERVWEAARQARAAGIRLALCSGRPAFGVALTYAQRLDAEGWHAFQNGASVLNLGSGESHSSQLPDEVRGKLIEQARAGGHLLEIYSDREYVAESDVPWAFEHAQLLGVSFVPSAFESLRGPTVRAQWLVRHEIAADMAASAPSGVETAVSSSPLMPDTAFVGITRVGTSKGSAIRTIAADYGLDLADVMYVGDADNDLPALELVGHPVAMANASERVLAVASRVVAHVNQDGLAEALRYAVSISR